MTMTAAAKGTDYYPQESRISEQQQHHSHPVSNMLQPSGGRASSLEVLAATATCSNIRQAEFSSPLPTASDKANRLGSFSPSQNSLQPGEAHVTTIHLTEIPVQQQELGSQTIANRLFHIQHMPSSTTTYLQESSVKTTATNSPSPSDPFPSPPYSPQFNHNFKTVLNTDASIVSAVTAYPHPPGLLSSPLAGVSILESSPKSYLEQLPNSQASYAAAAMFPNQEPTSLGSCLHTVPAASVPSTWWTSAPRPSSSGSWSVPPLQSTHSTFTYPNGATGFRPLSPFSPLSPMSSPGNGQPVSLYAAPGDTQQLTHVDSLRWSPLHHFDPNGAAKTGRSRRYCCTCPNCINGINSKVNGSPKKKQHICHYPRCGKVFDRTSRLRNHLRWHTRERPFVCTWLFCGKQFTRSNELQRHLRTHTGEKPFVCPECSKRFKRNDYLRIHIKTQHQKMKEGGKSSCFPSSLELSREIDAQTPSSMCSPIPEEASHLSTDECNPAVHHHPLHPSDLQTTASITSLHQRIPHLMLPPPTDPIGQPNKDLTTPCVCSYCQQRSTSFMDDFL